MRVPFFEVRNSHEYFALGNAAERVITSGQYILGQEVERFEEECARYLGVKYAIGVSSGTDALIASLMCELVRYDRADEVIVPAFTFAATAQAVVRVGARPVFADVKDDDLTIDLSKVRRTEYTFGIIPVDLFGACADVEGCKKLGVTVIEDAAQAFGSFIGTSAHMTCYSFFPTKNLAGFGDGGLITTDSGNFAERLRAIRVHGSRERYHHDMIGGNFRLDALQAALLRVKLARLPHDLGARLSNVDLYIEGLDEIDDISMPKIGIDGMRMPKIGNAPNQYVIRVRDGRRDALRSFLAAREIGTEVYYPVPLHLQPCFQNLGYRPGSFPVAERAAKEVLALPIFPGLLPTEIKYVCDSIREFFTKV